MPVKWTEDLSVGIPLIDRQHQGIFANINELLAVCEEERGREAATEIIDFLGNYMVKHFTTEETIMIQSGYSGFEEHRAQHAQFIENFLELKSQFENDGPDSGAISQINRVIVTWQKEHIRNVDRLLGEYIHMKSPA